MARRAKDTSGKLVFRYENSDGAVLNIFERSNSLNFCYSQRSTRVTKTGDKKTWFRRSHTYTVIKQPNGIFRAYGTWWIGSNANRSAFKKFDTRFEVWDQLFSPYNPHIGTYLAKKWGLKRIEDVFPLIGTLKSHRMCYPLSMYLQKTDNFQDLTTMLFGKTRYRKDLVKAVARSQTPELLIAHAFRGLVPIDWIVKWLVDHRETSNTNYYFAQPYNIRPVIRSLDQKSLRRLLNEKGPRNIRDFLQDITRMGVVGVQSCASWQDLHEQCRKLQQMKDIKEITYKKRFKKVIQYGDTRIVFAPDTGTLWEWGNEMSNCIYGYARMASTGHVLLAGVYHGEKLIGNMEISNGKVLKQLLGKFNTPLAADAISVVEFMLSHNGYTVPTRYLGAPNENRALV